jgi:hypothetical protein
MPAGGARETMTDHPAVHDEALIGPHGADDHGDDGEHDDHAHPVESLGPVDVVAWTYAALGIVLGLIVAAALAVGSGVLG